MFQSTFEPKIKIEVRRLDLKLITFSSEDFQEKFHDHNYT